MERKDFYVYEWYNTDTNEVFYVGKGCGNRYKEQKKRNKSFFEYVANNSISVRKVFENLTEEQAFALEEIITEKYRQEG